MSEQTGVPPLKLAAVLGGWACLVLGLLMMWISAGLLPLYGSLYLAALILAWLAISRQRVVAGAALLLVCITVPPVLWVLRIHYRGPDAVENGATYLPEPAPRGIQPSRERPRSLEPGR